jgi:hypothetical protein
MSQDIQSITLKFDWQDCERGNTWLTNGEGDHAIWITLAGNLRLAISIALDNYPGLFVGLVQLTDTEIAGKINAHCVGWYVRKCNVPGVKIVNNEVTCEDYPPTAERQ